MDADLVSDTAVVLQKSKVREWTGEEGIETYLEDVVVLHPECDGDLLGDRHGVGEVFVWELVHLYSAVWKGTVVSIYTG